MHCLSTKLFRLSLALVFLCYQPLVNAADRPVIAAAASVKFALQEIAAAFQQDTGKSLRISYASSGNLTRQIMQGSPFELFLSANAGYVSKLVQQHKTQGQANIYALGRLALIKPKQSTLLLDANLQGLKLALQQGKIKHFAMANPEHAPYGVAARETLQSLKLWEPLQAKLVLGENAAQAAQFTSSAAAEAGLISYSLALATVLQKQTEHVLIPATHHQPLQQSMVLLKNAGETAQHFFNYLQQDKARVILSRYGYSAP
ncbi:MAG: molybdate ABC transporter substrate-binding protein [Methyloprofundus sp.]|nr:molybdate ABC transporter substrate-binding protein [Methyloprofundus sp.]